MKVFLMTKHNLDSTELGSKLFNMNSRAELEVLILGLRELKKTDLSKLTQDQRDAIAMNHGTLESQLWNRYYRWDVANE